jgi:hypothetical protein
LLARLIELLLLDGQRPPVIPQVLAIQNNYQESIILYESNNTQLNLNLANKTVNQEMKFFVLQTVF